MKGPILTLAAFALLTPVAAWGAPERILAVFPIQDTTGRIEPAALEDLADYLGVRLAGVPGYSVLPRSDIRQRLISEKAESYRACYDQSCQIEVGRELAANKVVATKISALGSRCIVASVIFDLERSATDAASSAKVECSADALTEAIERVARELAGKPRSAAANDQIEESAWIEGTTVTVLSIEEVRRAGLPITAQGVRVVSVRKGSAGDRAGLKEADIVVSVGSGKQTAGKRLRSDPGFVPVDSPATLLRATAAARSKLFVKVLRSGDYETLVINLDEIPEGDAAAVEPTPSKPRRPVFQSVADAP